MVAISHGHIRQIDRMPEPRATVPTPAAAAALPGYMRLQHRFALRQHQHYLTMLLGTYRGPLHATWEEELARVNALLAELGT